LVGFQSDGQAAGQDQRVLDDGPRAEAGGAGDRGQVRALILLHSAQLRPAGVDILRVSGTTGVVNLIKRTGATTRWLAAAMLLAAVGTGCSSSSDNNSSPASSAPGYGASTPASAPASGSPSAGVATVSVADSKLGKILVGTGGRTLYLFEADTSSTSTCSGSCAAAWPPLVTTGAPVAGQGAKANLVGTSKRSDGTTMVTYNGHPLYYYVGDSKAGDTTGEELTQFGAKWYVLNASGDKVEGD
jgi:predicted lipoprotein with Yx(FWY)xxD motif